MLDLGTLDVLSTQYQQTVLNGSTKYAPIEEGKTAEYGLYTLYSNIGINKQRSSNVLS